MLIDGNGLGHRCFHSLGEMKFEDTAAGVVDKFLHAILQLGQKYETNDLVFCWDSPPYKRREIFPYYKVKEKKELTPEEEKAEEIFYATLNGLADRILPAIGFKNNFAERGYEGDDIIAALTKNVPGRFLIVSSDSDMWQLLDNNVDIHNPANRQRPFISATSFHKEWGINPKYWWMVKALAGCKSDAPESRQHRTGRVGCHDWPDRQPASRLNRNRRG